jgi:general transcription factor 3C polypeptide 5 (transcription factor C subunit 1)
MQHPPVTTSEATPYPLPPQHFYSVEYPGYVSRESLPTAIQNLGGQPCLDHAFRKVARNEGRDNLVDLKFRPENPFSHPVPGDVTSTSNLLLKVVKRKRRRLNPAQGSPDKVECVGEYTAQVVGNIPRTLRFRSESSQFGIYSILPSSLVLLLR